MKCIVLAAGYATRLYPLTENFPKPLLKVGDKTILDWLVDDISSSGEVDGFAVVSNHKFSGHFREWASMHRRSDCISVVDDGTESNETRLGAVRDIKFAIDSLGLDDDVLVIAGDNVLDFSLAAFVDYTRRRNASCVMRYFEPDSGRLRKCGVLEIGEDDRVLGMEEKPENPRSNWCCPPFYYYTRDDAGMLGMAMEQGCGTDAPGSYVAWLSFRVPVYAMEMPGKRYDIGNLESYRRVCEEYKGIL